MSKATDPLPKTIQSGESDYKTKSFMKELEGLQPETEFAQNKGPEYKYKESDVGIDEFGMGAVIGAHNYFTKDNFTYSCIVEQPCDVIAITFETIDIICDVLTREKLKPLEVTYPSDEELLEIYGETFRWEKFKQTLLQNTLYNSRQMKKVVQNPRAALPKIDFIPKNLVSYLRDGTPKTRFFLKKHKLEESKSTIDSKGTGRTGLGEEEQSRKVEEEQSEFRQTSVDWGMAYMQTRPQADEDDFRMNKMPTPADSSAHLEPSQQSLPDAGVPSERKEPTQLELPMPQSTENSLQDAEVAEVQPVAENSAKLSRAMSSMSAVSKDKQQMQRFIMMFGPQGSTTLANKMLAD